LAPDKCDADRYAILLARIDEEVGGHGQIVHEGVPQEAEHCLPGRKVVVVSELKAEGALGDCVEAEDSFNIQLIVWRTEAGTKVVGAEKDDLSGFFEQIGHG